jgi:NAD(P)-dependent dehydrogenase (short-subunit alcohol dehydrogenase family)
VQLQGKIALVTGGGRGIGRGIVDRFLEEGAQVAVVQRQLLDNALAGHPRVAHVKADLSVSTSTATAVEHAVERFGGLDILVNNAGGPPPGTSLPRFGFIGLTDDDWRDMLEFNLLSAVRACRAAIPAMLERGGGAIVNISSVHGRQPSAVNVDYGAAKAAMINLTKALSEEFGPQGIRVNGVCPGPVRTPWWTDEGGAADILAGATGTDREAVLTTVAPEMMHLTTGRLAEPQEIAHAVAFLASPHAASTTGTEVVVDSGMMKA